MYFEHLIDSKYLGKEPMEFKNLKVKKKFYEMKFDIASASRSYPSDLGKFVSHRRAVTVCFASNVIFKNKF